MECGKALIEIQENKLWRAGDWPTWEDYCRQVAGLSKSYASRIMKTSQLASKLSGKLPIGNSVTPVSESQVRPLLQLQEFDQQEQAWVAAVKKAEGRQPTAAVVQDMVFEILNPEGPAEPSFPPNEPFIIGPPRGSVSRTTS